MSILEDLFFGDIHPNLDSAGKGSQYDNALHTAESSENALMDLLRGREKELLIAFANAQSELTGTTAVNKFTLGFRLGALFMVDVFTNAEGGSAP